jgi:RNA polymerase sigma factor (sigma-70 family)
MAQEPLVKQFLDNRDAILGFILALTRDYDAAEEIFQEVAMVILKEAERATVVANFMAWGREVARRHVADYYKKRARRDRVGQPSGTMEEVIAQAFEENETVLENQKLRFQCLLECIQRLSGRSRELIEGFYGRRKSLRELAVALAWQEDSVKVALSRARKTLADCIKGRLRLREGF